MATARVLGDLLASTREVALRRARGAKAHPDWSFEYEVTNRFLQRVMARVSTLPPEEQRATWEKLVPGSPAARRLQQPRADVGGVPCVWFAPPGAEAEGPVLLYLHGGAMVFGSVRTHAELAARLALAAGARTLFVEYRLAPEHPFPAALDDARAAWEGLLAGGIVEASRVVVAGDSAGGNLALALLVALRDQGGPLPAGGVLLSPWVDLDACTGSCVTNAALDWLNLAMLQRCRDAYLGGRDARALPLASPLHADLSGLPPLLVEIGEAELFRDQAASLAERALAAGTDVTLHSYPGMTHVWQTLGERVPQVRASLEAIGAFVREHSGSGAPAPTP